jgi:protein-tyrosine-phosphatase
VVVVCTGNIARGPALAMLLQGLRPDLQVYSAAVGLKAKRGLRIPSPMRAKLAAAGFGDAAEAHRSKLLEDVPTSANTVFVATAPIHVKRLAALGLNGETKVYTLKIADPVWEGKDGYDKVYPVIEQEAVNLASTL